MVGEQGKLKIVWVAARHTILPAANTIYISFCTIPLYYTYMYCCRVIVRMEGGSFEGMMGNGDGIVNDLGG